ncbi:hypothetical protein Tco_1407957 [Tanacetum coccineum]
MSTSNQQTLADSGANDRPPMLERGNYIPWESRFRRPMIPDPNGVVNVNGTVKQVIEPLSKMAEEWSKYVTMVRHNQTGETVSYDMLYDSLVQFEPHVLASKARKATKNHDPLALIAQSNASSSQSHATSSYSPQPYYVTHPSSVVDYEDEYQGENQAVIQDGRVDIQTKNAGYGGNGNRNAGRQSTYQAFNACNENDDSNQIVPRVP